MGAELAYQYGNNVPGGQITVLSAVGRYSTKDYTWSGTLGPGGIHICYYQKASDQLQIGVEVETSLRMQESTATIGYQVEIPKADLIFRGICYMIAIIRLKTSIKFYYELNYFVVGSFDSNWTVSGVLEKRLQPMPFSFALSGRLSHAKNQFRLGCGLIIG